MGLKFRNITKKYKIDRNAFFLYSKKKWFIRIWKIISLLRFHTIVTKVMIYVVFIFSWINRLLIFYFQRWHLVLLVIFLPLILSQRKEWQFLYIVSVWYVEFFHIEKKILKLHLHWLKHIDFLHKMFTYENSSLVFR